MKRFFVSFFMIICFFNVFSAQVFYEVKENVVVTATKEKTEKKDLAKNVKVITKEEIEKMAVQSALDVLSNITGVIVAQNGGYGGLASVYLRGASPSHTVIMVDGIEINDPMSPGRIADLSSILASDIERIEVVYGNESAVYGSDAMAGVINIITVSGEKNANFFFEGGSNSTTYGGINFQSKQGDLFYWFKGSFFDTDGISAADSKLVGNSEKDGYSNATFNSGFKLTKGDNEIAASLIYINADSDLDVFGGSFGDAPEYTSKREDYYGKFEWKYNKPFGLEGYSKLGYYYTKIDRKYDNTDSTLLVLPLLHSNYSGEISKINFHTFLKINESNFLSFGFENIEEKGDSYYYSESQWGPYESVFPEKSVDTNSAYLNFISKFKYFTLNLGARYDDHDEFGSKGTFNAGIVVPLTNTLTFKLNSGTGFKAPSLFQLYSDMFGSTGLKAETSDSYEAFFEKKLMNGKMNLSFGYFYNKYKNLIYFDMATYKYSNGNQAETKGGEITFYFKGNSFNWYLGLTNISYSADNPAYFYNRPEATINFGISYSYDKWLFNVNAVYYNDRTSYDYWSYQEVQLDSFTVVNVRVNYSLNKKLILYLKGMNIFDEDYQYVYGYGTPGAQYFIGIKYRIY